MLLQPQIQKKRFKKSRKGRITSFEKKSHSLKFAKFGIKATQSFQMSPKQIETCRVIINKKLKIIANKGKIKIWIRLFPFKDYTKKPKEVRMGKGKGSFDHWAAIAKAGQILFEFDCINIEESHLIELNELLRKKLSIQTSLISR